MANVYDVLKERGYLKQLTHEEEIKELNYIDKYILEKIYLADKNNDSKVDYIDLNKEFRL